jgi:hypothetical protein
VFEIAGVPCRVVSDHTGFWELLAHYAAFTSHTPPRFSLEVVIQDFLPHELTPSSNGPYAHLALRGDQLSIHGPGFEGEFNYTTHRGTISQPLDLSPFETFLTAILGRYLREAGGFFLHSAGLQFRDRVLLFFGPSGSGKTTLATVVGEGVLSDEIVALRRDSSDYCVYGVPWRGTARSGRLSGCFALRKASSTQVRPISESLAVRRLLPSIFFTTPEAEELAETFRAVGELAAAVPCFDLDFTPERVAWEYSLASLRL